MNRTHRMLPSLFTLAALSAATHAQTVTVTTSADSVDVNASATIGNLPGPDGVVSLREALLVTDNTPGHQTIGFAIPPEDWYLASIYPGLVLIQGSFSWNASDSLTIDGTTQTAFTGNTNADGNEVVLYGLSLYLDGEGSIVTGLHDSRVELSGSNAEVHGNTGGMNIVVYSGSGSHIHDNEADTIKIDRSSSNVVVRNTTARVRVLGWTGGGQAATNNRIGGPDPSDRNFITGWGNYGQAGLPGGTTVELFDTDGTLVQNNYIGTTPDGMGFGSIASTVGIGVYSENNDLTLADNLVAVLGVGTWPGYFGQFFGSGIYIEGSGAGVEIVGNSVGLNALGEAVLGSVNGVQVGPYNFSGLSRIQIGGPLPGEANVIAGHRSTGVLVGQNGQQGPDDVRISRNSIFANGSIAIDLTPNTWTFGATENDPFDADAGANGLQNYPLLFEATRGGSIIRVKGGLHSEPFGAYTVEFFASPTSGASASSGQGQLYLGTTTLTTDANGDATFDVGLPMMAPKSWVVTSTATHEPVGATSEFSPSVPLRTSGKPWVFFDADRTPQVLR